MRKVHTGKKLIIANDKVSVQGSVIYLQCPNCHKQKHLELFGIRQMAGGDLRNQPWCTSCRGDK